VFRTTISLSDRNIDPGNKRAATIFVLSSVRSSESVSNTQSTSKTAKRTSLTKKGRMIAEDDRIDEIISDLKVSQSVRAVTAKAGTRSVSNTKMATTIRKSTVKMATSGAAQNKMTTANLTDNRTSTAKIGINNKTATTKVKSKGAVTPKIAEIKLASAKMFNSEMATAKMAKKPETSQDVINNRLVTERLASDRISTPKVAAYRKATTKRTKNVKTTAKMTDREPSVAEKKRLTTTRAILNNAATRILVSKTLKAKMTGGAKIAATKRTTTKATIFHKEAHKSRPTKGAASRKVVLKKVATTAPYSKGAPKAAPKKLRVKQLRQQWQQLSKKIPPHLKLNKKLQLPGSQESGERDLYFSNTFLFCIPSYPAPDIKKPPSHLIFYLGFFSLDLESQK
jgi:hypothetical protein